MNTSDVAATWVGRFPKNEIISLLDVNRSLNLAESTAQDLTLTDVLGLTGAKDLADLKLGYGRSAGSEALRRLIGASCGVSPDCVLTTQGTALGLFLLAFELCRPGDEAVLVGPCFPPSRNALIGCGISLHDVRLSFDEGYQVNIERIARALTPRTRLVSIATPQNPSGVTCSTDTLIELLSVMRDRAPGAYLFVDETYREAVYGNSPMPTSAASLDKRVITGSSISKAHGAPGLRVGWLTVPDALLVERLTVAKLNMVISGSVLDEALAAVILSHREQILKPRRELLSQALAIVEAWHARERHRLDWVRPNGGALCCMRLGNGAFDRDGVSSFWATLPELDLQLAAGTWFGEDDRVFRLGFGYLPIERLPRALTGLSQALDRTARAVQAL